MTTYRIQLSAPREQFDVTFDKVKHEEQLEFWGDKFTMTSYSIENADATISIPKSWTLVEVLNAADLADGAAGYGYFLVDVPKGDIQAESLDEWLDLFVDELPVEWMYEDVLNAK